MKYDKKSDTATIQHEIQKGVIHENLFATEQDETINRSYKMIIIHKRKIFYFNTCKLTQNYYSD